jgi:hypothetical protein
MSGSARFARPGTEADAPLSDAENLFRQPGPALCLYGITAPLIVQLVRWHRNSDFPFRDGAEVNGGIADYGLKPEDIRSIEREVALKLIPRLRQS